MTQSAMPGSLAGGADDPDDGLGDFFNDFGDIGDIGVELGDVFDAGTFGDDSGRSLHPQPVRNFLNNSCNLS